MRGAPNPESRPDSGQPALTDLDVTILAFERQWGKHAGAKEEAIRSQLGLSAARYYQLLGVLIDSPPALAHDPMLIKQLQRMRDARMHARRRRSVSPLPARGTADRGPDQTQHAQ